MAPLLVGRYAIFGEIASGGMATVHYGRLMGPVGFSRTVAIKRLHAQFAKDPEFVSMFLDEARLAARVVHSNAVQTLDVVAADSELFLVLEYVQGESLTRLVRAETRARHPIPLGIVSAIVCGMLHGLHAAHEATGVSGEPLGIVHRDVSPHNVLVGAEGVARVIDFGVAKATGRVHTTREGQLKGKLAYMAPEQLRRGGVDRRTDVFAAGIVLWEMLTLRRLFAGESEAAIMMSVLDKPIAPPGAIVHGVPPALDEVVLRALQRDKAARFATAQEMALALEAAVPLASPTRVGAWVTGLAGEVLAQRARIVRDIETGSDLSASSSQPSATDGWQATTVSVSQSITRLQAVSSHRGRYAAAALAAVAFVALGIFGVLRPHATPAADAPATTVQSGAPLAPAESSSAVASSSSAHEPDTTAPSPGSTDSVVHSTPRKPSLRAPMTPAARQARGARPCEIRAYVDESGIKRFVQECR
jgi:serine/threonine-protein kinase